MTSGEQTRNSITSRFLRVVAPNGSTRVFPVPPGSRLRFGRDPTCEVQIDDANISRNHFEVFERRGALIVRDLKSLNGTRLNGITINEDILSQGDEITVGQFIIRVVESRAHADHDTAIDESPGLGTGTDSLKIIHRVDLRLPDPGLSINSTQITSVASDPSQVFKTYQTLGAAYRKMMVLMTAAARVGTLLKREELLERFLATLLRCYDTVSAAAVFMHDPTGKESLRLVCEDSQTRERKLDSNPSRERLLDDTVRSLAALYAVAPRFDPDKVDSDPGTGYSMMAAPILMQGKLVGVLYCENEDRAYAFDHLDLDILSLLAFHIASSVENARLMRESDNAYERASRLFEEVTLDKKALLVELQRSEKKFRALFEQSGLAAVTISPGNFQIRECNDAFSHLTGHGRRELAGRDIRSLVDAVESNPGERIVAHAEGNAEPGDLLLVSWNGETIPTLFDARMVQVGDDTLILCTFVDISATKEAERETLTQLSRITALGKFSEHLMATLDPREVFHLTFEQVRDTIPVDFFYLATWDQASGTLVPGLIRRRTAGDSWSGVSAAPLKPPAELVRVLEALQPLRENLVPGETSRYTNPLLPADSPDEFLRDRLYVPLAARGELLGFLAVETYNWDSYRGTQLDFLKSLAVLASLALQNARLYQSTREQQESLRQLSGRILSAQEDERRRISRELHDGVGQSLTALRFQLETLKAAARHANAPESVLREAQTAGSMLGQVIDELRAISLDLRPTMLDDLGLEPAIEWFLRMFTERSGIRVDAEIRLDENTVTPDIATSCYRIVQEAVNNVQKHAEATLISIRAVTHSGQLEVVVRDNGKGFDPARIPEWQAERGCSGLLNMKERALLLGGTCRIHSAPGEGTTLSLSLPLEESEDDDQD